MLLLNFDCKKVNNYKQFCLTLQDLFFEVKTCDERAILNLNKSDEFVNLDSFNDLLEWIDFELVPCKFVVYNYDYALNYLNKQQFMAFQEILEDISSKNSNNFQYEIYDDTDNVLEFNFEKIIGVKEFYNMFKNYLTKILIEQDCKELIPSDSSFNNFDAIIDLLECVDYELFPLTIKFISYDKSCNDMDDKLKNNIVSVLNDFHNEYKDNFVFILE